MEKKFYYMLKKKPLPYLCSSISQTEVVKKIMGKLYTD